MEKYLQAEELSPDKMLHPLSAFLVPLFFVQMGLKIDFGSLFRIEVLALATALTVAAIVGKQACGLGALDKNLNRISIGIGMIPARRSRIDLRRHRAHSRGQGRKDPR